MWRVDIAGGGIAGLALGAGLLHRGVPVTVYEAGDYPRHRTCGEFINGLSPAALEALGLTEVLRDAPRRRFVSWTHGDAPAQHWELTHPALAMSRGELDARLADVFSRAGGELVVRSSSALEPGPGHVFATGRRPDPASPWFGLKTHLENFPIEGDLEFHVGRGAYAGICRLEGGRANLCGLFHRHPRGAPGTANSLAGQLRAAGMNALAARVDSATIVPGVTCAVAGLRFGLQPTIHGAPAVGDAFAFVPPFTGRGMASAFASAASAVAPLAAWSRGERTWDETVRVIHARQMRLARRSLWRAALVHPFLLRPRAAHLASLLLRSGTLPLRRLSDFLAPSPPAACFSTP